jgi:hypothetical protein
LCFPSTEESPAISKRKPPSQRPELKKDETALAIARMREEAKAAKPTKSDRALSAASKARMSRAGSGMGFPSSNAAAPPAATKRQKSG